jgi:hypothetical protein
MRTHLVIPDTQVKPGVPTDHLGWIGRYIIDRKPDVIVHLGDHWDMPSLSAWDKGKLQMEGRRYADDIESGNEALKLITAPTRRSRSDYTPEWHLLLGNHEQRIERAVNDNGQLEGAIGYHDFDTGEWEVHGFLEPVFLDGVGYSHYWANHMTGKPIGGMVETRLKTIGHSFTMGHVQTLQTGIRFIHGPDGPRMQRGLVAGACYLHTEDYKGPQANAHWRGVIVKHEVNDGSYDLMEVSLDYLCRKYEGVSLAEFMESEYPDLERRW